jgi:glycerophosphoryl diester phosphodiesterase/endonuclease/exonuclease/phosphatase family metal-dependent hydrolase
MPRFVLAAALALAAVAPAAADDPPAPVRVMSYNIRYGTAKDGENHWDKRKDFLAETVAAFNPDLLGTQETLAFQRDYLAGKLTGYAAFGVGRDDGKDGGEMAALFYRTARFEKLAGGHFWLSETPDTVGSKGWDAALPRIASWVRLKDRSASGTPILFLNAHFDHVGKKARQEAAKLIRAKAAELGAGCRVVVTGDFNAGEGSGPYTALFGPADERPSPFVDTFRVVQPTRGKEEGTFSGFKATATSGERIDWIAASRDWEVKQAAIDRTAKDGRTPSDHFAVTAILAARGREKAVLRPYTKRTNIAHRGASGDAPEHTIAAYELALKHGADYVEPDLQLTKDGVLVCLHDTTLERTTNVAQVFPDRAREVKGRKTWPVADFTLAEIRRLDAGAWKGPQFAGARVPTFQEMIDVVKGKAGIIPETKDPALYGRLGLNMEKALMEVLRANKLDAPKADPKTPVVIQSFSADSLKTLRKDHACKLPLVYLFAGGDTSEARLKQIQEFADGIAPAKPLVLARPEVVKDAHALGMSVTVWTFRSGQTGRFPDVTAEMQHFLMELKVDAVFTDNPDRFPRD